MRKLLLILCVLLIPVNSLYAMKYSDLYVFGDSLSSQPTGWTSYFIVSDTTFTGNVHNYAVSGANSTQIFGQVENYLNRNSVKSDALYVIFGGTNDGVGDGSRILQSAEGLHAAGAKYIMVSNLHYNPKRNSTFIRNYNNSLLDFFNNSNANVLLVDTNTLFEEMYARPTSFGFASSGRVLTDDLHFSQAAYGVLSDYFSSVIEAGSLVSLLPEIALSAVRGHQAVVENDFLLLENGPDKGKWIPLFDLELGNSQLDKSDYTLSHDSNVTGLTAGFAYAYESNVDLGAILGIRMMNGDFGASRGDYSLSSELLSLFAKYTQQNIYVDMVCTGALFSFDTNREVSLGTLARTEAGDTDGTDIGISVKAGMEAYTNDGFTLSPYVSMSMQSITVSGYAEDDSNASSLKYSDQKRNSAVLSFGVKSDYKTNTSWADVTYNGAIEAQHDTAADTNTISYGVKTLEGSSAEMIGYSAEAQALFILLGVNAVFQNDWIGSISFKNRTGSDSTENSLHFGVKKKF